MKLSAVALARTLAYIETIDLDPKGKVYAHDLVSGLVERYKFLKFPSKPEEFDDSKGVIFEDGKSGNKVIHKFTIFQTLLVLETRSNTEDSKQIIEEMLVWGAAKFGLNYQPGQIKRFAYVSGLTFFSDVPILSVSPAIQALADNTSKALSDIWQEPIKYEPTGLSVGHNPLARKYGIAQFTISRRSEARFSENKYYSEAPLPTDMHTHFLQEFESQVRRDCGI